jgi:hypothetical protein
VLPLVSIGRLCAVVFSTGSFTGWTLEVRV